MIHLDTEPEGGGMLPQFNSTLLAAERASPTLRLQAAEVCRRLFVEPANYEPCHFCQ